MKSILAVVLLGLTVSAFGDITGAPGLGLSEADNGFAFGLLRQIAKGQPAQNIFISPYSVSTVLQILGNGAAGKTRAEIQGVLKTDGFAPGELNAASRELNQSLASPSDVTLDLANSIWFNKGIELKPGFVSTNREFFQVDLESVNFKTPEAADTINKWAEKNTRGKIADIVSFPFPATTEIILANAIYFKGQWASPFDTNLTAPRNFYLPGGVVKVPRTMSQTRKFSYAEAYGYQAVELPYAGNRLEMILFLPATNSSPQKLLTAFDGKSWNDKILSHFLERDGKLEFPKFKLNYDVVLNDPLQALGMQQAFVGGSADFSPMADGPLFVSEVKQKSYVDVNEEGTEAAAVTTVLMTRSIENVGARPFEMIVDRPFLFVIADKLTQTILFMGIVNDPTL
jgi:serine protease inhibitor